MCACGNDKRPGIRECCAGNLEKKFNTERVVQPDDFNIEPLFDYKEEINYWLKVLESPNLSDEVKEAINKTLVNIVTHSASPRYVIRYKGV